MKFDHWSLACPVGSYSESVKRKPHKMHKGMAASILRGEKKSSKYCCKNTFNGCVGRESSSVQSGRMGCNNSWTGYPSNVVYKMNACNCFGLVTVLLHITCSLPPAGARSLPLHWVELTIVLKPSLYLCFCPPCSETQVQYKSTTLNEHMNLL